MHTSSENAPLSSSRRLLGFTGCALFLLMGLFAQPDFPARLYDWLHHSEQFLLSLF